MVHMVLSFGRFYPAVDTSLEDKHRLWTISWNSMFMINITVSFFFFVVLCYLKVPITSYCNTYPQLEDFKHSILVAGFSMK